LHVAKSLVADGGTALSIPQLLKEKDLNFEADEIGLVYPKYREIPEIVKEFLTRAQFKCDYFFGVITYGRHLRNDAQTLVDAMQEKKVKVAYVNGVKMADNRLQRFDMAQELKENDPAKIDAAIAAIVKDVDARKQFVITPDGEAPAHRPHAREHNFVGADEMFEITDACIGCAICERVCPRGCYTIEGDHAKAQGMCEQCLACAQACPQLAIAPTEGDANPKARYRNPNVSLREIERANSQMKL
ncbi:MAG: EFR1 family ferrodoxin, partial [Muribaculaceae bacterium]|nr:EFR1 family ferrodoxin [Muribaculaceae bacterium]